MQAVLDKNNFIHENVSAKNDEKIYDSIKDFGIKILRKKNDKKLDVSSTTTSGMSANQSQKTGPTKSTPVSEAPKAVQISNQK